MKNIVKQITLKDKEINQILKQSRKMTSTQKFFFKIMDKLGVENIDQLRLDKIIISEDLFEYLQLEEDTGITITNEIDDFGIYFKENYLKYKTK